MLTIFALTVTAIVAWFVVVFRQLARVRRLHDPMHFARMGAATVAALAEMNAAAVAATSAMEMFGMTIREMLIRMEAGLLPMQREIYDELRAIGAYPLDAMNEARARWPD